MEDKLYYFEIIGSQCNVDITTELFNSLEIEFCSNTDIDTAQTIYSFYSNSKRESEEKRSYIISHMQLWKDFDIKLSLSENKTLKKEDWTEVWKKYFKVLHISDNLVIKASWLNYTEKKNQTVIEIDPGMSFGTGSHETTQFCLKKIEELSVKQNKSFLDAGCGSGILSIAAAKFGYKPIYAFDYDMESIIASEENFKRNNIAPKVINLKCEDISLYTPNMQFDFVNANIISSVLVKNKDRLISWVKQGGYLILAGILRTEYNIIRDEFLKQSELIEVENYTEKEWTGGLFIRKN